MSGAFAMYVPVLHQGHIELFNRHPDIRYLALFGPSITSQHRSLQKDLRAIDVQLIVAATRALQRFDDVFVVEEQDVTGLAQFDLIVMPSDEICDDVRRQLVNARVEIDDAFLRWSRKQTVQTNQPRADREVAASLLGTLAADLFSEAATSLDWWRQVGAALMDGQTVIDTAVNHHLPRPEQPYIDGDPRSNFQGGDSYELSTAIHAEALLIARAAHQGRSTAGLSILVSTFPCPPCAKLIGAAGISTCYYIDGYAVLDGESVLRHYGVEIVHLT